MDHSQHGRASSPELGPDDPDCPCRGTAEQRACADAGCGFCLAVERPRTVVRRFVVAVRVPADEPVADTAAGLKALLNAESVLPVEGVARH